MQNRVFFLLIVSCTLVLAFSACYRAQTPSVEVQPVRAEFVIGTVCAVTLYHYANEQVYRDVFARLREIENLMSVNISDSYVARINQAAGLEPVEVPDDVFTVIQRALYFAELSGGAFDPTIGPLVSLWDIGGDNQRVPSPQEIAAVLPLINWRDVELDAGQQTVFLRRQGMALDLGAIAKGFAADEAAVIIREAQINQAIVDLGGNILTIGVKQDGTPWRVGLQNPLENRGAYFGIVTDWENTVVTSGVYERNFIFDGTVYHHLFSPTVGYPVRNGLLAVAIVAANSMDSDALSTAVFVMGYERGMALIESLDGVEAIFVFEDMSIRKTGGIDFTLTDEEYRLLSD